MTQLEVYNSPIIEIHRENKGWNIDEDGMLRVPAYIIKQGVFPYAVKGNYDEFPKHVQNELKGKDAVHEFINLDSLSEDVLATLEGKPVIAHEHEWQEADGEQKTVGSIAGKPEVTEDGYVKVDLLITDADTREQIKDKELIEISAGYTSKVFPHSGDFDGEAYDLEQEITRFNHVAILPLGQGRCGRDVRILNKNDKEQENMSVTIERTVGEAVERFTFNSDDDAKEAKRMADAVAGVIEKRRQNAEEEMEKKENELEVLRSENEGLSEEKGGLEARIASLEAKLDQLLALEVKEQEGDESVILEEELNEADAEEVAKEVAKENSLDTRRKVVVEAVARMNGLDASAWEQNAVDAQFQMLSAKAKRSRESRESAAPRTSNIPAPEGGFKRQNAAGPVNKAQRAAKARIEANKGK